MSGVASQAWVVTLFLLLGGAACAHGDPASADSRPSSAVDELVSDASGPQRGDPLSEPDFVRRKLAKRKFPPAFARKVLGATDWSLQDEIVELNVFGFLKASDYSPHLSDRAIERCQDFLEQNKSVLRRAERRYGVPKEVIASLLWVETRHGKNVGSYSVPGVYALLAGSDHPAVVARMLARLEEQVPRADPRFDEYARKVRERTRAKAQWALEELRALKKIHSRRKADVFALHGSFAGAFGFSQFIPSSYLRWSKAAAAKRHADLFKADDAIHSVGNFLKAHGWRKKKSTHRKALFGYNRSTDYVETILKLAALLRSPDPKRELAKARSR